MSKSLGNFFTIRDVLKQYDGETIRFSMLRTQYRSLLNFSDATSRTPAAGCAASTPALVEAVRRWPRHGHRLVRSRSAARFRAAMNEDFATPEARGRAVRCSPAR